jgi:superoxide dismutase, Cu-Zn family
MKCIQIVVVASVAIALCACNREERGAAVEPAAPDTPMNTVTEAQPQPQQPQPQAFAEDPGADKAQPVTRAVATLSPTKGNKTHGTIVLTARQGGGLDVKTELSDLPKGAHAYHVHQFGDCTGDEAKSAGTHFNFEGSSEKPGDNIDRITGNLGELEPGADGKATATATIDKATLQGQYSILGRSVVVHEKGNDPKSPPMGAAGGRIACGVIGVADADAAQTAAVVGRMKKP